MDPSCSFLIFFLKTFYHISIKNKNKNGNREYFTSWDDNKKFEIFLFSDPFSLIIPPLTFPIKKNSEHKLVPTTPAN